MKGITTKVIALTVFTGLGVFTAQAARVGYCLVAGGAACLSDAAATAAGNTITATGNTPVTLTGLSAAQLAAASISVLWILNENNGDPGAVVDTNTTAIANFVGAGGVLSFHDRNVNQGISAGRYIPGAGGVAFTNNFSSNIDIVTPGTGVTNGPFGTITNTTLDGGNFSNHGWADLATLPAGAVAIFSDGTANHIVDFWYQFGA